MKKILLLAVLFVGTVSTVTAQRFDWGARAGLSMASVSDPDHRIENTGAELGVRTGFYAGVFAEIIDPNESVGLQLELLYTQLGSSTKLNSVTTIDRTDYLTLPLMVKTYVLFKGFSIDAGFHFSYLLSARNGGVNYYDADGLRKFDIAPAAGFSYKFLDRFDASIRAMYGLNNRVKGIDSENENLQIGLGYRF